MKKFLPIIFVLLCGAAWGTTLCPAANYSTTFTVTPDTVYGGTSTGALPYRIPTNSAFATVANGGHTISSYLEIVACDGTGTNVIPFYYAGNNGNYSAATGYIDIVVEVSPSVTGNASITIVTGISSPSNLSNAAQLWTDVGNVQTVFDLDGASSLLLADATGTCTPINHGVTNSSSGYNGLDGAASFNGSSYADLGCAGTISGAWSEEFWFNATNANGQAVAGNWNSGQTQGFMVMQNSNEITIYLGSGSGTAVCQSSPTQVTKMPGSPGNWEYIVVTYNNANASSASSYQAYVNGLPMGCYMSTTSGSAYSNPTQDILLGRWANSSFPDYFTGLISRYRLYSKVLTQGQIQTMWFNNIFPSLSGYYGTTDSRSTYGLDQLQPILQMSSSSNAFSLAFTSGTLLIVGRTTSTTASLPSGCGASGWTLLGSDTSGVSGAANIYFWGATGANSSPPCTITLPSGVTGHGYELASWISTTVDVSNHGSLTQTGKVRPPAITTTVGGDFLFSMIIGNAGALGMLTPAVRNQMPQQNPGGDLSGTNAVLSEQYYITNAPGSYYTEDDNYCAQVSGNANTAEQYVQIALKPISALAIQTSSLPTGALSTKYEYTLQAVGGVAGLTWSLNTGSAAMPAGLTLNPNGVITGLPTGGTTSPTFKITDGTNTATKTLTLTVNSTAGSCTVATSSSSSGGSGTVSIGVVSAGNIVRVATLTENDNYTGIPTDAQGILPFKFIGTINSSGSYLVTQFSLFQAIATGASSGSDSVSSTCSPTTSSCATLATQFTGCQAQTDYVSTILGSTQNIGTTGSLTTYGPAMNAVASYLGWDLVAAGIVNNGGYDFNFSAGSGWTADATSGSSGVWDMMAEHKSASGGLTAPFGQNLSTAVSPQQVYFSSMMRPTTSGTVSSGGFPVVF